MGKFQLIFQNLAQSNHHYTAFVNLCKAVLMTSGCFIEYFAQVSLTKGAASYQI